MIKIGPATEQNVWQGYMALIENNKMEPEIRQLGYSSFKNYCDNNTKWGIFDDKDPIGIFVLDSNSAGVAIRKKYWGKTGKVLKQLFALAQAKMNPLKVKIYYKNINSIKLADKLGFVQVGKENNHLIFERVL